MTEREMKQIIRRIERDFKRRTEKEVRREWRERGWVYIRAYTVPAQLRRYKPKRVKLRLVA